MMVAVGMKEVGTLIMEAVVMVTAVVPRNISSSLHRYHLLSTRSLLWICRAQTQVSKLAKLN